MRYSLSEYILYINFRFVSMVFMALPVRFALLVGRALGIIAWRLDFKHKRIAYRNLRIALAGEYSIADLKAILKRNYQNLGMNLIEVMKLTRMDKDYINRYIKIRGKDNLDNALRDKRGAIILGAHFGSWEVCFAIAGVLNYPLCVFAEEQTKNPLLNDLLIQIRQSKGVEVLRVSDKIRQVVSNLKDNKFVGMVADHGAKEGLLVDFFGRKTRTPAAAVRISLKLNVPILIGYIRRIRGPKHELVILPPLKMKNTGNFKQDIMDNLETVNKLTQGYITQYPEQYFWSYKRFKHSAQRNILLLHDGKAGHLRQIQAVLGIIKQEAATRHLAIRVKQVEVEFKNKLCSILQALSVTSGNRKQCQGCSLCLKQFLNQKIFKELQSYYADIVVSCGSSIAAVNFVVSSENQAKSVVIMRPSSLSIRRFNLVIMPAHDNPPNRRNVVKIQGALNLVNEEYLGDQVSSIRNRVRVKKDLVLGLLLGGNTKRFRLSLNLLRPLISQIKLFLEMFDAEILITTSRRTSNEVEQLMRQEFANYDRCRLLIIAKQNNIPEAVGGILGLSKIVIVSPESISMISEAASSGRYVVVFTPRTNIGRRHSQFLENLVGAKLIHLVDSSQISKVLENIIIQKPEITKLQDSLLVKQAVGKLF